MSGKMTQAVPVARTAGVPSRYGVVAHVRPEISLRVLSGPGYHLAPERGRGPRWLRRLLGAALVRLGATEPVRRESYQVLHMTDLTERIGERAGNALVAAMDIYDLDPPQLEIICGNEEFSGLALERSGGLTVEMHTEVARRRDGRDYYWNGVRVRILPTVTGLICVPRTDVR